MSDRVLEPFPHALFPNLASPPELELLARYARAQPLIESRSPAYDGHIRFVCPPADLPLMDADGRQRLKTLMERTFDAALASIVYIAVQHQRPGDVIRPHNDFQRAGERYHFSHRLILYLPPGPAVPGSGELQLLAGREGPAIRQIAAEPGLGVGFEASPRSFHCVTAAQTNRWALVFSFPPRSSE